MLLERTIKDKLINMYCVHSHITILHVEHSFKKKCLNANLTPKRNKDKLQVSTAFTG